MAVQWKDLYDIDGYEWVVGYRIGYDAESPAGGFVIQSCRKKVYVKGQEGAVGVVSDEWHDLKTGKGKCGYLQTVVYTGKRKRTVQMHRVGFMAFGPPKPEGCPFVLHRNDNKDCNDLENLYWGSPADNMADRSRNGHENFAVGKDLPQTKITADDAKDIYRMAWEGQNSSSIARKFGISQPNVSMIKHKKSWRHIHALQDI